MFGAAGITCCGALGGDPICTPCTVTIGGGPVPCVEDAVSSISALAANGELTVAERFGDVSLGDDILILAHLTKFQPFSKTALGRLLFNAALELLDSSGFFSSKFSAPLQ